MKKVKFEGIDGFNRPVFKDINSKERYGSAAILFGFGMTEEVVLKTVSEENLYYFGNSFNCEPMGYPAPENIKIIRSEVKPVKRRTTMRSMEILFDDLTDEAKREYLEFIEAKDMYDINPEIPIATIDVEDDE